MLVHISDTQSFFVTILAVNHIMFKPANSSQYAHLTADVLFLEHGLCRIKIVYNDELDGAYPRGFNFSVRNKTHKILDKNSLLKILGFNSQIKSWIENCQYNHFVEP